ncbi:MAG: hypothetical protein C0600_06440 [Ignavibacteria bacterium]|nr:MAG: hypothetical protein C0600_06440 [Ignavibacteria bacterium]
MEYKQTYIDGYNVLRKISRLERLMKSNSDAARRSFVEFVRKRARSKGHITIVFDGHGDVIGAGSSVAVVFSLTRTADDWIRMNLEQHRHPRMVLVVSSDNEVRGHALECGSEVMSSQEFIADRKTQKEDHTEMYLKTRPVPESEVRYWLNEFDEKGRESGKE